jgi:Lhr-like helicase
VQLASYLQGRGVAAAAYHGSLSGVARQSVAKRLAAGELRVVTCTTALSTGLDLHNIDGILHHTMPASLEDYVQQVLHITHLHCKFRVSLVPDCKRCLNSELDELLVPELLYW